MNKFTITPKDDSHGDLIDRIRRMERVSTLELITFHNGRFKQLAKVSWYMSRSSTATNTHCIVWLNSYLMPVEHNDSWGVGVGACNTLGVCRQFDSFNQAIRNSGVTFHDKHYHAEPEVILEEIARGSYHGYKEFYFAR